MRKAHEEMVLLSKWDFVHRFPGASGIRLMRGVTPENKRNYSVFGKFPVPKAVFFSYIPEHALSFTNMVLGKKEAGSVVVADVPVESIQRTVWIYPPAGVYEPEVSIAGETTLRDIFNLDQMEDFYRWMKFEQVYVTDLQSLPGIPHRDSRETEREMKDFWFRFLMERKFREIAGDEKNVGEDTFPVFRTKVKSASEHAPDYSTAVQWVEAMIEAAADQTRNKIEKFLQNYQFPTAGLEEKEAVVMERPAVRVFKGSFENGNPARLAENEILRRLPSGERVTLEADVDRVSAQPQVGRIFVQKGASIPPALKEWSRVDLPDDLARAEAKLIEVIGEQAGPADLALVTPESVSGAGAQAAWNRLFQDYRLPGILMSNEALAALKMLTERDPAYLAAFLVALEQKDSDGKPKGGLLVILSIEIDEQTPGQRRLFLYA
ncbi:MAG: hypothetical protein HY211_06895 [Candidatus Omnitrophica bacterium]|nr:hypothetical protein [Candidatus Omnitrophota bacterium]